MTTTEFLPFDPAELTENIRVRPAHFARMCKVSRQTVSQWIKSGKISLYPDGTLDPAKAASAIVTKTDPTRLRAKVFRLAVDDAAALRKRIAVIEAELADAKGRIIYLEGFNAELDRAANIFDGLVLANRDGLALATDADFTHALRRLHDVADLIAGGFDPYSLDDPEWEEGFDVSAAAEQ